VENMDVRTKKLEKNSILGNIDYKVEKKSTMYEIFTIFAFS